MKIDSQVINELKTLLRLIDEAPKLDHPKLAEALGRIEGQATIVRIYADIPRTSEVA